jgi:type I restriction enzyme R subunit
VGWDFIVFEDAGGGVLVKKMAGYRQYHAVNCAMEAGVQPSAAAFEPGVRDPGGVRCVAC